MAVSRKSYRSTDVYEHSGSISNAFCRFEQVKPTSQLWHCTDGAIRLARELCSVAPTQVAALLPAFAAIARLEHFPQADTLRETLWKSVPIMAKSMGKRAFQAQLDALLEPLFATVTRTHAHQLAGYAAIDCMQQLSTFLGHSVFIGRLSTDQAVIMQRLPGSTCTDAATTVIFQVSSRNCACITWLSQLPSAQDLNNITKTCAECNKHMLLRYLRHTHTIHTLVGFSQV